MAGRHCIESLKTRACLAFSVTILVSLCATNPTFSENIVLSEKPARSASLAREARASVRRAVKFLAARQLPDGSWSKHPAITALVVSAMLRSGESDFSAKSDPVKKGLAYVRKYVKPDGGIYEKFYNNYTTSVCMMALHQANLAQDRPIVRKARLYLLKLQADEKEGFSPADAQYGGFGYEPYRKGGMRNPDLSNLQWAIEAIKVTEDIEKGDTPDGAEAQYNSGLAYGKALKFLGRCQNLKAVNDLPWAGNDGGFVYGPAESKAATVAKGLRSYGSMTYAGLKSMIYARVDKNDKRVIAAYNWVRKHWSLDENPELGQQGIFYYYQTLAKALNAYGREIIVDEKGGKHDWRTELIKKILSVQQANGSWANRNARWMEAIPELTTAYCVILINETLGNW